MDEDSIDLETLQAQIDMSMSFAQEMVSSWVNPSRKLPSKSRNVEAELKEYMRRPPRLGVGAAIPENANSFRDIARLKGQLAGKGNKRPRHDEADFKEKDKSDDDEGESRGGAMKKKARVDPFGNDSKKKKKNKATPESVPPLASPKPPTPPEEKELDEVVDMVTEDVAGPSSPSATPKRKKCKKKHGTTQPPVDVAQAISTPVSPRASLSYASSIPVDNDQPDLATTPPKVRQVVDASTPATPLQLRRQAQSVALLLQQPLLNLGPTSDAESEHEDDVKSEAGDESPKKKRRRRRKKKKKGDATVSTMDPDAVS
ncbi:hypothetical protein C0991_012090 [Blastosporella zonata]|nr:hypothetical protein C0991_012090 [Blastosporella zonata]